MEIRSHVDHLAPDGGRLFSRDCPEFDIVLPTGERLVVIPNHLKSKRNGNDQASRHRRQAQARAALDIAMAALSRSPLVLLGGDLHDTSDSPTLAALFTEGFQDVMIHPNYPTDRPGTYETRLARHKMDYPSMSPLLQVRLHDNGIERRGTVHPGTGKPFDTVTKVSEQASDHHLLWADFDFGD